MPHTADVILEAWAPDFSQCCEEAVIALLGICIDGSHTPIIDRYTLNVRPASQESMLLDLLDEIIFVLDTVEAVPVAAEAHREPDGALEVILMMGERDTTEAIGSAPKAISRSGLWIDNEPGRVRCAFLIDV